MLTHRQVWMAIDALAAAYEFSPSGLAKRSGLDSTAFNKSKRISADGRPRWPSTESLSKIIEATGVSLDEFVALMKEFDDTDELNPPHRRSSVPLLGLARAGAEGHFDDDGRPVGEDWDLIEVPWPANLGSYALRVQGDAMLPLYRNGDILVVDPSATLHKGDRVVVKTGDGEVMAKVLRRQTAQSLELVSLDPAHAARTLPRSEVDWAGRIMWASQ
jgi:phage repressor protein C with HTH and peptisase S24 domain